MRHMFRFAACLMITTVVFAQSPVRTYVDSRQPEILKEFAEFLAMPNIASDTQTIRRNAEVLMGMMQKRGLAPRLLESPGAPPVVYGELLKPGATRTVVFYAHYDGQPVDPKEWAGGEPFQPTLRTAMIENDGRVLPMPVAGQRIDPEWRLYARSSSDDKAPIVALMAALDALKANGGK